MVKAFSTNTKQLIIIYIWAPNTKKTHMNLKRKQMQGGIQKRKPQVHHIKKISVRDDLKRKRTHKCWVNVFHLNISLVYLVDLRVAKARLLKVSIGKIQQLILPEGPRNGSFIYLCCLLTEDLTRIDVLWEKVNDVYFFVWSKCLIICALFQNIKSDMLCKQWSKGLVICC